MLDMQGGGFMLMTELVFTFRTICAFKCGHKQEINKIVSVE